MQAILALGKALQASPGDAEALLSLGVSYTNELDRARALTNLMEWLKGQPGHAGVASVQLPQDARERLRAVVKVFRTAAQMVSPFFCPCRLNLLLPCCLPEALNVTE